MVTVQLLGGTSLRSGDAPLNGPPAQRHRLALLALIVAAWPQPLSRDRAMGLLWPERDLAGARRLLNLAVHVLRSALGEGAILSTGDGLVLNPSCLSCDLLDLRTAVTAGASERVIQLYTGPLMDGFHLDESTEFGYWLDERRNEITHAYTGALLTLAAQQERSGDVHGRVGTCRRLVAADPHSGARATALMQALEAAGDRAAATQHAIEHAQRLKADLELDPDPDVMAFAERLRTAPAKQRPLPGAPRPARPASVAVLPFRNLSDDPENEYFADGITEDVISHLAKIRALDVISSGSVMRFKQRHHTMKEIAASLGATTVLEGSVRRSGDRVRIVAQLVDPIADRHLWAGSWDRELTDIFAIQTEVALQIAAALEAELSPDERLRVKREPTTDLRAYQLYLQGRQWLIRFTADALARSLGYFERAVARDPAFALAHAGIAMAYIELVGIGATPPGIGYPRATSAAAKALSADPELGVAHGMAGYLKAVCDFDWTGAEQQMKRALELSPGSADAYDMYGRFLGAIGRHGEAIRMLERAQALDPLAHRVDLATALLRAGRFDEGVMRAEDAVELDPYDRAHATLGWAYFLGGRQAEGIAELERAAAASPESTMWLAQLGEAHGMAGNTARAREILSTLEEWAEREYVPLYHLAYVHTGLGNLDRAIDLLERAVSERTGAVYGVKASFLFKPLHAHPRFRALLERMKLG